MVRVRKPQYEGKHSCLHFVNYLIYTSIPLTMICSALATGDSSGTPGGLTGGTQGGGGVAFLLCPPCRKTKKRTERKTKQQQHMSGVVKRPRPDAQEPHVPWADGVRSEESLLLILVFRESSSPANCLRTHQSSEQGEGEHIKTRVLRRQ